MSSATLEAQRLKRRDQQREKRARLTEEELALRRQKDAERKRFLRAQLPDEEESLRRQKQTGRARIISKSNHRVNLKGDELLRLESSRLKPHRSQLNNDELSLQRIKHAARQRQRRANLTEEEKAIRRKKEADRKRELRSQFNEKQRALMRVEDATKQKRYNKRLSESSLILRRKLDAKRRENKRKCDTESDLLLTGQSNNEQLILGGETLNFDETGIQTLLQIKRWKTLVASLKDASMELIKSCVKSTFDSLSVGEDLSRKATEKRKNKQSDEIRRVHKKSDDTGRKVHKHRKLDPNRRKEMFPIISNGGNNFVCVVCDEQLDSLRGIKLHLTYHTAPELSGAKEKYAQTIGEDANKLEIVALTVFECEVCSDKFYSLTTYRKHIVEKHKENRELLKKMCFPCSLCAEAFIVKMALTSHQRNFHNIFTQCPVCSESFENQESFAKHVEEKHLDCDKNGEMIFEYDEGYFCKLCGVCSRSYVLVNSHFKEAHTENTSFECDFCKVKFDTRRSLVRHKHKFHEEKPFCCELCGERFINGSLLRVHKRKHSAPSAGGIQTDGKIDCKLCEKSFGNKANYRHHYIKVHQEKRFSCTVCGKSFPRLYLLHQHRITVCEKAKSIPKPCPICGKILDNYMFLEYHKHNVHKYGNPEENVCHVCNKTFKGPANLRIHNIRVHRYDRRPSLNKPNKHQDLSLECANCGRILTAKAKLLAHWRLHREEMPFKCSCCEMIFKCKYKFYRHRESAHGNDQGIAQLIIDSETDEKILADFNDAHADQFLKISEANLTVQSARAENNVNLNQQNDLSFPEVISSLYEDREVDDSNNPGRNNTAKEYVDFSRANVPARQETVNDAKNNCDAYGPINDATIPKLSSLSQGNKEVTVENKVVESDNDLWEPFEISSPIDSPLSEPDPIIPDKNAKEDRKPFVYWDASNFNDPFLKRLTVEIERLKECLFCNEYFSSSHLYKEHLNSKGHRLALRVNKKETILIKRGKKGRKEKGKSDEKEALLPCPFCDKKLGGLSLYIKHIAEHKKKENCTICPEKFATVRKLVDHYVSEHNGENLIKCETCDMSFLNKKSLREHTSNKHGNKQFKKNKRMFPCDVCGDKIKDFKSFRVHLLSHENYKHKCVHCAEEFKVLIAIEQHYKDIHNGEMPFSCGKCPQKFATQLRLQQHENKGRCKDKGVTGQASVERSGTKRNYQYNYSNKTQLSCSFCDATFWSKEKFKSHMVQHNKRAMCLLCPEGFATVRILVKHYVAAHNGEKLVKCEICDTPFLEYQPLNLSQHMADQHDYQRGKNWRAQKIYSCDVCGVICEGKILLNSHLLSHKKEKHKCVHCDAELKGLGALEGHYNETHNGEMPFPCGECPLKFPTQRRLQLHQKETHPNSNDTQNVQFEDNNELVYHKTLLQDPLDETEKVFCDVCGKFFFGEASLTIHMREHTGENPYQCTLCGKAFFSPAILKLHVNNDHKKVCHPCDTCGKSFNRRQNLVKHCQTYHSDSFQPGSTCQICSQKCKNSESLEKHMRFHDTTRRYPCDICSWRFKKSSNLSQHKKYHNEMGIDGLPHVRVGRPPSASRGQF